MPSIKTASLLTFLRGQNDVILIDKRKRFLFLNQLARNQEYPRHNYTHLGYTTIKKV